MLPGLKHHHNKKFIRNRSSEHQLFKQEEQKFSYDCNLTQNENHSMSRHLGATGKGQPLGNQTNPVGMSLRVIPWHEES